MLTLNDGRPELWQWDTGRTLSVDADCSQVHFSNKVFGRSIDVDVIDGVAIIPDILLQTDKDLNVWAFVGTAENGYTKISKTFKVNRRNKPSDYVFTPPEQTSLEEIKKEIEYLKSIQDPDAIKNAVEDYLEQNPPAAYTLPIATETTLGGVKAAAATEEMTQPVGITAEGKLVTVPGQNSGGNADSTGYATERWVGENYQPKGEYLTEVPEGYAKTEDIPEAYTLPVGGNELGGVKNGGNVTINGDGTMTAPEVSGGSGIAVTGASVGQTVKIAAVDEEGVPTAWEPVDMPSGGVLHWIEVADITTEEQTQKLTISVDKDGRPISQYNALWMIFAIYFPADESQTSTNGALWIYPFPKTGGNCYRYIANVAGWKTTARTLTCAWAGLPRITWSSATSAQTTFDPYADPDFLSGLCVYSNSSGDHIPAGTRVRIAALSKGVTM